jgi:hypothetical protein
MAGHSPKRQLRVVRLAAEAVALLGIVLSLFKDAGQYVSFLDDLGLWVNQLILNYVPYPGLFLISFTVFLGLMLARFANYLMRPRLKLALAEIRDDGDGSALGYYVRVEATNGSIRGANNCTASLKRVERLGSTGPREYSLPLDWTDIGEASIDIAAGEAERFDVAKALKSENKFTHCSRKRPPRFVENMPPGDYVFTVVAKCAGRVSEPFRFGIKWDGKWDGLKQFDPGHV